MRLSDSIETFIKALLAEDEQSVELKRNELAEYFGCAPSQINYVLATRFSVDHGYIIESRRGGGGFVRIVRIQQTVEGGNLLQSLLKRVGNSIDEDSACAIILHLLDRKLITPNEATLMRSAIAKEALALPINAKDILRASVFSSMLKQVFRNLEGGTEQ